MWQENLQVGLPYFFQVLAIFLHTSSGDLSLIPLQTMSLFFRFTQTVMTLTWCGQDLTSSLTSCAAFKTTRRSTTFPGMTKSWSALWHCSCILNFSYPPPPLQFRQCIFWLLLEHTFSLERCLSEAWNESYSQAVEGVGGRCVSVIYLCIYFVMTHWSSFYSGGSAHFQVIRINSQRPSL